MSNLVNDLSRNTVSTTHRSNGVSLRYETFINAAHPRYRLAITVIRLVTQVSRLMRVNVLRTHHDARILKINGRPRVNMTAKRVILLLRR